MPIADFTLTLGSSIIRIGPYFRGLDRIFRLFNEAMLKLGAWPILKAKMKDGTIMYVDLRTYTELEAYYRGTYDSGLIAIVKSLLDNPDSVFLDIGANIGFYTISIGNYLRSKNGSGRVVSFEPFEGNYQRMLDNLKLNQLESLCSVHKIGLSNEARSSYLTLREDFRRGSNTGNAAIPTNEEFDAGFRKVTIQLERLDDIWDRINIDYGRIDVIKMDIEGHEDFCLEGGKNTLEIHRPTILMEVNKPYYDARGVELNSRFLLLIPKNYRIYRLYDSEWKPISSFDNCSTIDNVFLVPGEKLVSQNYKIFN